MTFLVLTVLAELVCWGSLSAFGQTRSRDEPTLEGETFSEEEKQSAVKKRTEGDTKFVPSVTFSQRYDSNVLFAPSGSKFGLTPWDFVTTASPTIQLLNRNRYAESSLLAGVSGNLFVNNSDLNFVSTNLTGSTILDKFVSRFVHAAKLQISDSFAFSPESPSFISAAAPVPTANPFAIGLVPVRANMYTNTAQVSAAYPVTTGLTLQGTYSYSLLRIGEIFVRQPTNTQVVFFDTDQYAWSIGPSWRLSRSDNVSIAYRSTRSSMSPTSGALSGIDFTAQGVEATYASTSADWGVVLSGGATVLDLDNRAYPTGSLTLSAKYGEVTTFRAIGSRGFAPAFFATGGALISTNVGVSVEHRFSRVLTFTGSANYAYNEVAPVNFFTFESYTASGLLSYKLSRSLLASMGYSYTYFEVSSPEAVMTNLTGYVINRHVVTFSITGTWN
ncbi:MAG: hypothetical protein K0S45_4449 [Nitrospira sp.]|jgi:hypothetical protein|nr:hypothetical protein [Nitrospira sp.]